jgi:hypothetical protein
MTEKEMIVIPELKPNMRRSWFECGQCRKVYWTDVVKKTEEPKLEPPCGHNATQALISEPIAIMKLKKRFRFVVEEKK